LPIPWKSYGDFLGQGWEKNSSEFFKINSLQNPKNTKNQKPKVLDLETQGKSGF
jgi:hypothetical protein